VNKFPPYSLTSILILCSALCQDIPSISCYSHFSTKLLMLL